MAITQLAVGLKKQDFADTAWHTGLNAGFDDADTRLRRTYAGNPNGVLESHWVGQLCRDTTNSRLYVATVVGNPGTWAELSNILAPFSFGGTLSVAGATTLSGAVALNAGGALAAAQKLTVPNESWLRQGSVDMKPHGHSARHTDMTTAGTLGVEHDFVPRVPLLQAQVATEAPLAVGAAPYDITGTTGLDFSTRRGTSTVLAFGSVSHFGGSGLAQIDLTVTLDMDGAPITTRNVRQSGGDQSSGSVALCHMQTGVSAAAHNWKLRHTASGGAVGGNWVNRYLTVIDFGAES